MGDFIKNAINSTSTCNLQKNLSCSRKAPFEQHYAPRSYEPVRVISRIRQKLISVIPRRFPLTHLSHCHTMLTKLSRKAGHL